MAILTCDICGCSLSTDPSGEFAVCELCGAQKVLEKAGPAEPGRSPAAGAAPPEPPEAPPETEDAGSEKTAGGAAADSVKTTAMPEKEGAGSEKTAGSAAADSVKTTAMPEKEGAGSEKTAGGVASDSVKTTAVQTCDICGNSLSADTSGEVAVCELCGAAKVVGKAGPAEPERKSGDGAASQDSPAAPPEKAPADVKKTAAEAAPDPAGYVIPPQFSNAPFEKAKADLEKQISAVNINTIDLRGDISKAKNTAEQCKRELYGLGQNMRSVFAAIEHSKSVFADDPGDYRFAEVMKNHQKHLWDIKSNIDNKEEEMGNALARIPSIENEILENERKLVTLQAELDRAKDELRRTPAQRAEEYYQQLVNEKNLASTDEEFGALGVKFNEIGCYRDSKALKRECIVMAVKKGYDNMVQRKKTMDSNPSTTDEEYKLLARNVRLLGEFNIEELIQKCEDLANECDSAAAEARYKRLVAAKNKPSADENEYKTLAEQLRAMNGYKDTAQLAAECDERYAKLKERREERERQARERRRVEEEREKQEAERALQDQYGPPVQTAGAAPAEGARQETAGGERDRQDQYGPPAQPAGAAPAEDGRQETAGGERDRQDQYGPPAQTAGAAPAEDARQETDSENEAADAGRDTAVLTIDYEEQNGEHPAQPEGQESKGNDAAKKKGANRLVIGFAAVIGLAVCAVAVYFATRPSVESLFNKGKERFEAKNFTEAATYFSKAIKRDPGNAEFFDWRGKAYFEGNNYEASVADFKEAARLASKTADYSYWLGEAYSGVKNYDGAVAAYTNAIKLDSNNASYYIGRAAAYGGKKSYGAATADYTQAIRLNPKDARYWNSRGGDYRNMGDYDKAYTDYTEAIRLNSSEAKYHNNRGAVQSHRKKVAEAIRDYSEAIRLAPDNAQYYDNRADAYVLNQDYCAAAADYKTAARFDSGNDAYRKKSEKTEPQCSNQKEPMDARDGQRYRTVTIGGKMWLAQNMNYMPQTGSSWCYNDDNSNCYKHGRLYDWNTAKTACLNGWHLPSRKEWMDLVAAAGALSVAGKKLKAAAPEWNGSDDNKFSALPAGFRDADGGFSAAGTDAGWWTATEKNSRNAYLRYMGFDYGEVLEVEYDKRSGLSVRCVMDAR